MKKKRTWRDFFSKSVAAIIAAVMIFTSVDVTAFAADFNNSASDFQMYQSNCLKSMKITVSPQGSYATAYGRIAIYTKETGYSWDNKYINQTGITTWPAELLNSIPEDLKNDGMIAWGEGNEFEWTSGTNTITVEFPDGVVDLNNTQEYYVYLWTRSENYGIYPDGLICKFKTQDGKLLDQNGKVLVKIEASVDYAQENQNGLHSGEEYIITVGSETYTIKADSNGSIPLAGTDKNGKQYNFIGKTIKIGQSGNSETTDLTIAARPSAPSDSNEPGGSGESYQRPVDVKQSNITTTETSITIKDDNSPHQEYTIDGGVTWHTPDASGNLTFHNLSSEKDYILQTRTPATSDAPASEPSTGITVRTLKVIGISGEAEVSYTYDGKSHEGGVTVTKPDSGAVVKYAADQNDEYTLTSAPKYTKAGVYEYYYQITASGYRTYYGSGKVTILPRTAVVKWSDTTEFDYNGKEQAPTATVTNLVEGDTCNIEISGAQKDAGNHYTAQAERLTNPNYQLTAKKPATIFSIKQKEVTIGWENTDLVYNGKEQQPQAKVNGVIAGDTCNVTVTGAETNANKDGESYTAVAAIDNSNYTIKGSDKTEFTIAPKSLKDAVITLDFEQQSYTGEDFTQNIRSVTLDGVALSASDYTVDSSSVLKAKICGTYTVQILGKDNYKDTAKTTWQITDPDDPTGTLQIGNKKWDGIQKDITFDKPVKELKDITIAAEDKSSGVDKIYYYLAEKELSEKEVQEMTDWQNYKEPFSIEKDGNYIIYVKVVDKSGNSTYLSSDGMVLDTTAPEITGVKNHAEYCLNAKVKVTDKHIAKVTVDGKEITDYTTGHQIAGDDKEHTIKAVDEAGNVTEYTVTVYKEHTFSEYKETKKSGNTITETASCIHCDKKINRIRTMTDNGKSDITKEEDPSGGSLEVEVTVKSNTPGTTVSGLDTEVAKNLLTEEEKEKISNGEKLLAYLEVSKLEETDIETKDKEKTEEKAASVQDLKKGFYIDLSIWKKIGLADAEKINGAETSKKIKVTMTIPESLKAPDGKTRTYYIIRVHNGEPTLIEAELNGDKLSFYTDRFSTYSIWYKEKAGAPDNNSDNKKPTKNNTDNQNPNSGNTTDNTVSNSTDNTVGHTTSATTLTAPKTGDNSAQGVWVTLLLITAAALAGLLVTSKRDTGEKR